MENSYNTRDTAKKNHARKVSQGDSESSVDNSIRERKK